MKRNIFGVGGTIMGYSMVLAIYMGAIVALVAASAPPANYYNGTVVLYGNAPFTTPILKTTQGDFVIVGKLQEDLIRYQQKRIRVQAIPRAQLLAQFPRTPVLEVIKLVGVFQ